LLVLGCLILLIKRELNIRTPCGTSLSVTTAKTPFSSSLLISLRYKFVKGVSCTRTDISIGRDCLTDMPAEVIWFSVIGCFWGRPWLRFIAGLVGLVGLRGTSRVGRGASSSSGSVGASSSSSSTL
jgi:hypothetical protein